jgi:general secretion pathway protein I
LTEGPVSMEKLRLCRYRRFANCERAFTLLEVMIAVSIMAIALVTLLGSQTRSLSLATEARFNVVGPMLASLKLAEVEARLVEPVSGAGTFGEDFLRYSWEMVVEEATFDTLNILSEMKKPLQKVVLTVRWDDTPFSYTVTYCGRLLD